MPPPSSPDAGGSDQQDSGQSLTTAHEPLLKIHVGCGLSRLDGWVNADYYAGSTVDVVFDAQQPWPFPTDSALAVYGSHMLEHLPQPLAFFREAWRVLKHQHQMLLRVPYGGHRAAWWDLEHIRPWYSENFCCLQPGYAQAIGNPQHGAWAYPYGIHVAQLRVTGRFGGLMQWYWGRKWFGKWHEFFPSAIEELFVYLSPLKTRESVEKYAAANRANTVPQQFVIYKHHLERRPLRPGEPAALVPLADTQTIVGLGGA
mgnify:CR=1 FL=1